MIYVTGDLHGDISRFKSKEMRRLKKNETLLVCGDFGFLWNGSKEEKKQLDWIGKRRYDVLFVEGTHENMELLNTYPQQEWQGGRARQISGRLRQLCRGQIFELEGNSIFAFGGGTSEDSDARSEADNWWSSELPSQEEVDSARRLLEKRGGQVDFIITHQPSLQIRQLLNMDANDCSILDVFLDEVRSSSKFGCWFFGSLHLDKVIPPTEVAVFRQVLPLARLGAPTRQNALKSR